MARFSTLYKGTKPGESPALNVIRCWGSGPCFHCGSKTSFIDARYQAWFCSEECVSAVVNEAAALAAFLEANNITEEELPF